MGRKEELLKLFEDDDLKAVTEPMIEDVVFLESRLEELRELPFIRINPKNPAEQKPTAAAKQYKELLQQYNNCIKILLSSLGKTGGEEDSPLRAYIKGLNAE